MTHDDRPERVYGILVRGEEVFLAEYKGAFGLPGGDFPAMADNRKEQLAAHLFDQLGIVARATWAQGAFLYGHPTEGRERFSGFYTVWEWDGYVREGTGSWFDREGVELASIPASLRILLTSVLATHALRTT